MRTPFGQDFIDKARYPRQAEIYAKPAAADSPEMGLIEQALPTMLSGAAKERDKLTDISKKSKRLGYQQEADSLYVIDHLLSHATTMSQPFMRIDPVSKSLISLIASNVSFFGGYLQVTDSNRIDSKEPNKLYGRLADIFKYVLKPCFNNVKKLDGYVWTGSTSEGFAITDHSKQGVRYLNDEMDLMIPVAMVAESTKTDDDSACEDSIGVRERERLEESSTAEIPWKTSAGSSAIWKKWEWRPPSTTHPWNGFQPPLPAMYEYGSVVTGSTISAKSSSTKHAVSSLLAAMMKFICQDLNSSRYKRHMSCPASQLSRVTLTRISRRLEDFMDVSS
ncbi:uncharacterized protein [Ptychodera flava]|uniref:uncharacterized protein n=1 Tax=Ptychodera flava TaxID=63121 RepID=UPI00396A38D6